MLIYNSMTQTFMNLIPTLFNDTNKYFKNCCGDIFTSLLRIHV